MEYIEEVLAGIAGALSAGTLIGYLLKKYLDTRISAELERVKTDYKLFEVRSSRIHEQRVEKMHALYKAMHGMFREMKYLDDDELHPQQADSVAKDAWMAYHAAMDAFIDARVFMPTVLCTTLDAFFVDVRVSLEKCGVLVDEAWVDVKQSRLTQAEFGDLKAFVKTSLSTQIPGALDAMHSLFQSLLGVDEERLLAHDALSGRVKPTAPLPPKS